jgi:hypothetical protein
LRDAIKACVERLDRYRRPGQRIGEQNTKVMLVEPILQALGWDLFDPEEVNREYRRRSSDNPVDYALLLLRTPRLFVEAKGLGENLDDPRWTNQTISYAAVAGVEWVALTDGAQWRIYNAHAPVPAEEKLFRTVDIAATPDGSEEILDLLSKDNMRENRIQELWQGYFVDRQVHGVLTALFTGTEPASDLVNLVAKRTERLGREEVRASLVRARATFDFPLPTLAPAPPPAPLPHPGSEDRSSGATAAQLNRTAGKSSSMRPKVSPEERRIKLRDLLDAGRIAPGALTAKYDLKSWEAELSLDGSVRFEGTVHPSLSSAGAAVKFASRGPGIPESVSATDGWEFWSARDEFQGDVATLKVIRRRAAAATDPD